MFDHAVANLDDSTTDFEPFEHIDTNEPKIFNRLVLALATARNRVTTAVLEQLIPDTMVRNEGNEIGGILEYDGPTVMIASDEDRLGLEVRDSDLIFASGQGVWIGATHYDDMPVELENYLFITSGTRMEYNTMLELRLETLLKQQNDVQAFLMAA